MSVGRLCTVAIRHNTSCSYVKYKLQLIVSSDENFEEGDGPYRGFGYLSFINDPYNTGLKSQSKTEILKVLTGQSTQKPVQINVELKYLKSVSIMNANHYMSF